jgi:hypothetical protein
VSQSSLRLIINGNEIEGWKKYVFLTVVTVTGIVLVMFVMVVIVLGLMSLFSGGMNQ